LLLESVKHGVALTKNALFSVVGVFAVLQLVRSIVVENPFADPKTIVRELAFVAVVGGLGVVTSSSQGRAVVEKALIAGGVIAVSVSLSGFIASVIARNPSPLVAGFHFASKNNVIGGLPRLTGTSGGSPEHMAEYLVLLITVVVSKLRENTSKRSLQALLLASTTALVATLSWAWVAGVTVAAGCVRKYRRLAWSLVVVFAVVMSLFVNFGTKTEEPFVGYRDCATLDVEHDVTIVSAKEPERCRPVFATWPVRSPLKMYWEAKRTALSAFIRHPFIGVGASHYGNVARGIFAEKYALAPGESVNLYETPHCLYLGAAVETGVLGLIVSVLLVGVVVQTVRGERAGAVYASLVLGYLLVGINIDILEIPSSWFALGFVVGSQLANGSDASKTPRQRTV
jgi:hypothetical protein